MSNEPTKKCGFKDCNAQIPEESEACAECCYKLHVMIREKQGFTAEEARIEWERDAGPSLN